MQSRKSKQARAVEQQVTINSGLVDLGTIIILEGRERGKGEEQGRGEGDGDKGMQKWKVLSREEGYGGTWIE